MIFYILTLCRRCEQVKIALDGYFYEAIPHKARNFRRETVLRAGNDYATGEREGVRPRKGGADNTGVRFPVHLFVMQAWEEEVHLPVGESVAALDALWSSRL